MACRTAATLRALIARAVHSAQNPWPPRRIRNSTTLRRVIAARSIGVTPTWLWRPFRLSYARSLIMALHRSSTAGIRLLHRFEGSDGSLDYPRVAIVRADYFPDEISRARLGSRFHNDPVGAGRWVLCHHHMVGVGARARIRRASHSFASEAPTKRMVRDRALLHSVNVLNGS
jgi:hypothetical protein